MRGLLTPLGTVGLILVVLEGEMELRIEQNRLATIRRYATLAIIPIVAFTAVASVLGHYYWGGSFRQLTILIIPFSIISSAIAIPSSAYLNKSTREQTTYESSISDIVGVLIFNFAVNNEVITVASIGFFCFEFILMIIVSIASSILLSLILARVKHSVKFTPILVTLVLIYAISKEFHLPALLFVLLFGLLLSNMSQVAEIPFMEKFRLRNLVPEIKRFHDIVAEGAFIIRSLFFMLFGFYIDLEEVANMQALPISLTVVGLIYIIRWLTLLVLRFDILPALFIAPRGLITILLFVSIPAELQSNLFPREILIQVILLSAFIMMLGLLFFSSSKGRIRS